MVAEAFGTLATLFPDRIDLGLGRAPGTDMATARALRRYLGRRRHLPARRGRADRLLRRRRPGPAGATPSPASAPTCRSGSSARASSAPSSRRSSGCPTPSPRTSRPATSSRRSRSTARPSARPPQLAAPYLMLAFNVFAAETDAEGRRLRSSMQQAFVNLRTGRPGPLPRPVDDVERRYRPDDPRPGRPRARLLGDRRRRRPCARDARRLPRAPRPDELILTGQIHDHAARLRSFEIAAEAMRGARGRDAGGRSARPEPAFATGRRPPAGAYTRAPDPPAESSPADDPGRACRRHADAALRRVRRR